MASTSAELLPNLPEQDKPFAKKITQAEPDHQPDEEMQPKDYAKGATGLFAPEKKEIMKATDVVKAS